MPLDARLDGFISRLGTIEPDLALVEDLRSYGVVSNNGVTERLINIAFKIREPLLKLNLPFINVAYKISSSIAQKYIAMPDWSPSGSDENHYQEWGALNLQGLLNKIETKANDIGTMLADSAEHDFNHFYRLEVPEGCDIAFWLAPLRALMAYNVNYDSYDFRFDIIGETKTTSDKPLSSRFENLLKPNSN